MTNWKIHKDLQTALSVWLNDRNLSLPEKETYQSGIDCVGIFVDGNLILSINLPPLSNYEIEETKHTHKYLLPRGEAVA